MNNQPNKDFEVGHFSTGPDLNQNQTNTFGHVRGLENITTPQKDWLTKVEKVKTIPFQILLEQLQKTIPDLDQQDFRGLKLLYQGNSFLKNPKVILQTLTKIIEKNSDKIEKNELKESRPILLELFALFTVAYPEFLEKQK